MLTFQRYNKKSKKGQASLEFMATLSLALIIFTVFYSVISTKQADTLKIMQQTRAETIAENLAYQLDITLSQGTNFTRTFTLPTTIMGQNYSISLQTTANNFTYLEIESGAISASTTSAAPNVTGTIVPGKNILSNKGGMLYVN